MFIIWIKLTSRQIDKDIVVNEEVESEESYFELDYSDSEELWKSWNMTS